MAPGAPASSRTFAAVPTEERDQPDSRRNRRGVDPLAFRIFELLRPLCDEDKRCVLAALDAASSPTPVAPERLTFLEASLERFLSETGGTPSKRRYERWRLDGSHEDVPSATFIANTFGSWAKAMDALGHKPTSDHLGYRLRTLGPGPSDQQVIADLRRCGRELGKTRLLFREYRAWAKAQEVTGRGANTLLVSPNTFIGRFGSFAAALRLAGLEPARGGPRTRSSQNTPERLVDSLRRGSEDAGGGRISFDRYEAWRERRFRAGEPVPAAHTISKGFGGWRLALSAAGLAAPDETAAGYGRGRGRKMSIDHVARSLIEAARTLDWPLRLTSYERWRAERLADVRRPPPPSSSLIQNRIGTWTTIRTLIQASLDEPDPEAALAAGLRAEEAQRGR